MDRYDISDNHSSRLHTVRVTFQWQQYKGHIAYEVGGRSLGLNAMDVDFEMWDMSDIYNLKENDCKFNWNEEHDSWELILRDEYGNECEMNDIEENEINNYVVGVEIINCVLE